MLRTIGLCVELLLAVSVGARAFLGAFASVVVEERNPTRGALTAALRGRA